MRWRQDLLKFIIQKIKFARGTFREAFKATTVNNGIPEIWVVKKYIEISIELIKKTLNMKEEDHIKKQA